MGQTSELLFYTKASTLKKVLDINCSVFCAPSIKKCIHFSGVYDNIGGRQMWQPWALRRKVLLL